MPEIIFDGHRYQIYGSLPAVGSRAPDMSLVNTKLQTVTLANFTGRRKIMFILTSIDSPSCAASAIRFDELAADRDDVALIMVSYDLPFAHGRFFAEHDLGNVEGLSAIRHEGFGENYGVLILEGPLKGMFACAVVVIDENDTVVHTEQITELGTKPDYVAAFRALGIAVDPAELED
jgi:thiol peroxidase